MAYIFGDSFDLYAVQADIAAGYWDSTSGVASLVVGRFAGGQGLQIGNGSVQVKNSGQNDAIHHIIVAVKLSAISGSTVTIYCSLGDGATAQCSIVFRSDGVVLLTTGGPAGATLATWPAPGISAGVWNAFEFEVVISNTVGRFRARKNGNTVDDFDSGAVLNTRGGTANNYANRLSVGESTSSRADAIDDLLWRSDATSVPFVGDIRAYMRMPASDATAVFSRLGGATNTSQVSEAHQDGLATYIFSLNVNDADFYNLAALTPAPASVVAVTTRAFVLKSDTTARAAAVQIKSGGTTVAAPTVSLAAGFLWAWRTDIVNPATGLAWTAAAVDAVQIGPRVIS